MPSGEADRTETPDHNSLRALIITESDRATDSDRLAQLIPVLLHLYANKHGMVLACELSLSFAPDLIQAADEDGLIEFGRRLGAVSGSEVILFGGDEWEWGP